ncbi:unnamed protein product, partial [Notodromas monacha]
MASSRTPPHTSDTLLLHKRPVLRPRHQDRVLWSYPIPDCIPINGCLKPDLPQAMSLNCSTTTSAAPINSKSSIITDAEETIDGQQVFMEGTICNMTCQEGHKLVPALITRTSCARGRWTNLDVATCKPLFDPNNNNNNKDNVDTINKVDELPDEKGEKILDLIIESENNSDEDMLRTATILRAEMNFTVEVTDSHLAKLCKSNQKHAGNKELLITDDQSDTLKGIRDELIARNAGNCAKINCKLWHFKCHHCDNNNAAAAAADGKSKSSSPAGSKSKIRCTNMKAVVQATWTLKADFAHQVGDDSSDKSTDDDDDLDDEQDVMEFEAEMMLQQVQVHATLGTSLLSTQQTLVPRVQQTLTSPSLVQPHAMVVQMAPPVLLPLPAFLLALRQKYGQQCGKGFPLPPPGVAAACIQAAAEFAALSIASFMMIPFMRRTFY